MTALPIKRNHKALQCAALPDIFYGPHGAIYYGKRNTVATCYNIFCNALQSFGIFNAECVRKAFATLGAADVSSRFFS